jgi:hypothetical protein
MTRLRAATVAAVALVAAVVVAGPAPSLAAPGSARALTFSGQCQFTGTSSFSSAVTLTPAPRRNNVAATGTCTGTLSGADGRTTSLTNAAVQYQASEFGTAESCEADPNATGRGELLFQEGTLGFTVNENRISGQAILTYRGRNGGSASGVAAVNSSNPVALLEQCATSGITSAPVQIVFQTTPSISG